MVSLIANAVKIPVLASGGNLDKGLVSLTGNASLISSIDSYVRNFYKNLLLKMILSSNVIIDNYKSKNFTNFINEVYKNFSNDIFSSYKSLPETSGHITYDELNIFNYIVEMLKVDECNFE
ncbi:hypothetical protein BCR32DRAFT_274636 [Anaeromyces robustus]|uniref:Uncharacterized protein n=1 Tax=Anaeromyces robustus TaxID=1754192 RepID=A0A1Y1XNK3_9FUNG|nr:hypothetical protein BCR32DRAFT_274636 [Anaeromyces robustus]|eukprot:ORX87328.1 hypothetical protein BCR32DRAFT_274636 [Anaeromyces robustus]